jgi:hypothetical protein
MTRRRQFLLTVAIALPLALLAAWLAWRPFAVELMSRSTAGEFRRTFSPGATDPIELAMWEWAWRFGGTTGMDRLEELAKDESLTPHGRRVAAQLRDYIATGGHLPRLRALIEAERGQRSDIEPPAWPTNALIRYIYRRDREKAP